MSTNLGLSTNGAAIEPFSSFAEQRMSGREPTQLHSFLCLPLQGLQLRWHQQDNLDLLATDMVVY